jgi:hypothetical protein
LNSSLSHCIKSRVPIWFNPLVWLTRREIDRACELACDETVIRNLDINEKQNYGDTLIYVAADSKTPRTILSTTMCEEKRDLKERLGAIMKNKKRSVLAIIVSAVLLIVLTACAVALGAGSDSASENNDGGESDAFMLIHQAKIVEIESARSVIVEVIKPLTAYADDYSFAANERIRATFQIDEPQIAEMKVGDIVRLSHGKGAGIDKTQEPYTFKCYAIELDAPRVALYVYDQTTDPTNPDLRSNIGSQLTSEAEIGWTRLTEEIFIDVDVLPVGTVAMKTYYAEAGSEANSHIMSDFKYEIPTQELDVSNDGQPRGNSWNVAELFPGGFLGHIWAVTTDADGVEHTSAVVNVIFEPSNAYDFLPEDVYSRTKTFSAN